MCGIAGFTDFKGRMPADQADAVLARMTRILAHRGPDAEGRMRAGPVALGHRRLSIIDLETGAQPMSAEDGRHTLVYNGEVYNYLELRAEMEAHGHVFRTHSDTEVVLRRLILDGPRALQRFNGMFALALWDRDRERLLLVRDRLGVKPLYYARTDEGEWAFASEMKALLQHPGVPRRVCPLSVSKYFSFGYIPAPHTIYEGVFKLEPGAWMEIGREGARTERYWDIPLEDNPVSPSSLDERAEDLRELLRDAVVKRLRSDVPLGVFLSGGIDSSSIVALAAPAVSGRLRTFTVGFEDATHDESPHAARVAERFGTEHVCERLSADRALDLLPAALDTLDEPFADASILPTWLLSRFTAASVKVALGGDGGDELFAGYPSFQAHRLMERLSFLPTGWRDVLTRAVRRLPISHRYASAEFLVQQFLKGAGISADVRFLLWMGVFGNEQKRALFSPGLQASLLRRNPFEDVLNHVRQSGLTSDFERIQYLCMKMYLQDDILVKVDRASMAHGLEVRGPFLDYQLVEFAAQIPAAYKLRGLRGTKYILKHAMRGLLPPAILRRRKAGFMIPLAQWISGPLRPMVEDHLCSPAIGETGFFRPEEARRMAEDHWAGRRDHRKLIWALMMFERWRRRTAGGG
jgi:asparagine synthase (glutamine-hydrolysing)